MTEMTPRHHPGAKRPRSSAPSDDTDEPEGVGGRPGGGASGRVAATASAGSAGVEGPAGEEGVAAADRAGAPDGEGGRGSLRERFPRLPAPALAALVVATLAVVVGVTVLVGGGDGPARPAPEDLVAEVADRYLAAWADGDLVSMEDIALEPPDDFVGRHEEVAEELQIRAASFEAGEPRVFEGAATVPIEVRFELAGLGTWTYRSRLALGLLPPDDPPRGPGGQPLPPRDIEPEWQVVWDPTTIHPDLVDDRRLARTRQWPARAPLLAVDGTPLTGEGAVSVPSVTAHLLGSVRGLGAEEAAERGVTYLEGDEVGATGLQAALDERLAGTPGGSVQLVDEGEVVETLESFPGTDPQPVRTTIDVGVQSAAEAAVGEAQLAALVAVDVGSGEVRAVVNRPVAGFNRAIDGAYPPGSTFKVVTTAAFLGGGRSPDEVVTCPEQAVVGGRSFRNAGGMVLGPVPLRRVFADSCNTAFVQLASQLEPAEMEEAARHFGFGDEWAASLRLPSGRYPEPEGPVDLAASAIGQGRVTASPLQMAVVAATAASGAYRPPQVVVPEERGEGEPLPAGVVPALQEMMREVVTVGTGTAAQVPGEPVAGKTGTAEYGIEVPPRTHAWFIGWRGDLAVAVLVEDGGSGGEVAAPIAAELFARLG